MEETGIVKHSVLEHIKAVLTTAGWSDNSKWVRLGHIQPETSPPAVGIDCSETHRVTYEVGGTKRAIRAYVDIEIKANDKSQLEDLKDTIEKNLENMRIIDFNIAMPPDPGYDAEAQTIARGLVGETIRGRVVDKIAFTARVSFTLMTNKPI